MRGNLRIPLRGEEAVTVEKGLISFVLPCYRNLDRVFGTLESVFMQDWPKIEIVITDDGSPEWEESLPALREYIEAHRGENITRVVYHHLAENRGTVVNTNEGYQLTQGEYIKDLAPEDMLSRPDALRRYVEYLEESGCLICFAKQEGITAEGRAVRHLASSADDYDALRAMTPLELRNRLFVRNCLPAPAWFAKKELFETYGYYLPVTRLIEDYPYWIHLCSRGVRIAFLDEVLIRYRLSGSGSGNYSPMFMKDMYAIYEKCIFPLDRRYGPLQPLYNRLKRMGLDAYNDRTHWEEYSPGQRIGAWLKHGIFFAYIDWGNARIAKKNGI